MYFILEIEIVRKMASGLLLEGFIEENMDIFGTEWSGIRVPGFPCSPGELVIEAVPEVELADGSEEGCESSAVVQKPFAQISCIEENYGFGPHE